MLITDFIKALERVVPLSAIGYERDAVGMQVGLPKTSQLERVLIAYEVTIADPLQEFVPDPAEVHEMKWIGKSELYEQKIFDNCLHALEAYFK